MNAKREEVSLIFDGGDNINNDNDSLFLDRKLKKEPEKQTKKVIGVFILFVVSLLIIVIISSNWFPSISKGHSESESASIKRIALENPDNQKSLEIDSLADFNSSITPYLVDEGSSEYAVTVQVKVETELEDSLDYADEVEGLRGHVGYRTPHPDSVAFVLPLRDHVGNQGVRFAKRLKGVLEKARSEYESQRKTVKSSTLNNTSSSPHLPLIPRNDTRIPPSHVLVRDSKGDFEMARELTQHFYEEHGTTRFFGYLTDEEAMAAALWARVRAPGARFITPTAISTYLDSAPNVLRVQPSAKVLAAAVADLLITLDVTRPLMVVRASLHTDAFIADLRLIGIKPSQVIHYYETTRFEELTEKIRKRVLEIKQPVLLLGDAESWEIIHMADSYFSCLWICPFPTQLHDHIRTARSELIYFVYRAHDVPSESTMKANPLLDPNESIIKASLSLLYGKKRRTWQGSYIVVASVSFRSIRPRNKLLARTDMIPIMQYDVKRNSISRKVYHELQITELSLKPLIAGNQCSVIVRYIQELTGTLMGVELPVNLMQSTVFVPTERGAQLHVDCPNHHVDMKCSSPKGSSFPIKCRGTIQGSHYYQPYCHNDVGITFSATKGCMLSKALICSEGQSLGCRLASLCSSVSESHLRYDCDGIPIVTL